MAQRAQMAAAPYLSVTTGVHLPKPIVEGIFTRGGPPTSGFQGSAATLQVKWADVEPAPGVFDFSRLLKSIQHVADNGYAVRIRPMLGKDAPQWAKNLGLGPGTYWSFGVESTIGALWGTRYQNKAARFLAHLAAAVDGHPNVNLVFATAAMTYWGEPMIRDFEDSRNITNLQALGYTPEKDKALQRHQLDMMQVFVETPVAMSYNPLNEVLDGRYHNSAADSAEVMDYQIALYGGETVLQNNELGRPNPHREEALILAALEERQTEAVINFQCAAKSRVRDEYAAIVTAHDVYGATGVELANTLTDDQYGELDAYLKEPVWDDAS